MQPNEPMPPQIPPDPNTPPTQPLRRTVIQPLSSEDEIRQAAVSAGAPVRYSEPSTNLSKTESSGVSPTEATLYENTYESTLAPEPLPQPSQTSIQNNTPQTTALSATSKAKKPFVKVAIVIMSMLIVGALGVVAWLYFFNRVPASSVAHESANTINRESTADSVQERSTTQSLNDMLQEEFNDSIYLRPKEWVNIPASASASVYANAKELGSEELTAIIALSDFSGEMNAATDAERAGLRQYFMERMPDYILGSTMLVNAPIGCDSGTFAVTRSENTTKMKTTIGIADVRATCSKRGIPIIMKSRIVTGMNDGQARMIVFAATNLEWRNNEKTFQQMLDSVEEGKEL